MSAHEELDRLVGLAGEAGWAVVDRRAAGVLWFTRGRDYVHAGVNRGGEVLHVYGGTTGRPSSYWAARRDLVTGRQPDRLEVLEAVLVKQFDPYE